MQILFSRKGDALKRALYLCEANFHASRFCEELFNSFARTEGLNWQAASRAVTAPPAAHHDPSMSPLAVSRLRAIGVAPVNHMRVPIEASKADLQMSYLVVAVNLAHKRSELERRWPEFASQIEYWNFDCDLESDEGLSSLASDVRLLINNLEGRGPGPAWSSGGPRGLPSAASDP